MQELAGRGVVALLALDHQQVLLRGDVNFSRLEPGHGQRDAIGIFANALDIERRVIVTRTHPVLVFQQIKQPVKPDHGAAIRRKIKTVHGKIL